jgi:hypothetical protein
VVDIVQLLPDPLIRRQLNGVVVLDPELVPLLKNIFYFQALRLPCKRVALLPSETGG